MLTPEGREFDLGVMGTRRFWLGVFRWNLARGHYRAVVGNLRDFPRYMVGRG